MPSFPCLSKLTIGICNNLTYMPLHPLLEELELKNVSAKLLQQSAMIAAGTEEITIAAAAANFSYPYIFPS